MRLACARPFILAQDRKESLYFIPWRWVFHLHSTILYMTMCMTKLNLLCWAPSQLCLRSYIPSKSDLCCQHTGQIACCTAVKRSLWRPILHHTLLQSQHTHTHIHTPTLAHYLPLLLTFLLCLYRKVFLAHRKSLLQTTLDVPLPVWTLPTEISTWPYK